MLAAPLFDRLYRTHWAGLLTYIRALGVPACHASDIAQEVFLKVYLALPRYDLARPFKPWLTTITRRMVRDQLELVPHRPCLTRTGRVDCTDPTPTPEQALEEAERAQLLDRLLRQLPPLDRVAVKLSALEDRSWPQIALALGLPEPTVQYRLKRSHAHLRDMARRHEIAERDRPRLRAAAGRAQNRIRGGPP